MTNRQFSAFVAATGYVTDAERSAETGGPGAGSAVFLHPGDGFTATNPWTLVPGATWRAPGGPGSNIEFLDDYPVVHVSHADARAYADWAGDCPQKLNGSMPPASDSPIRLIKSQVPIRMTENPWPTPDREFFRWPIRRTAALEVRLAGCYAPSRIGLYDMIGNVWEWTDTPYSTEQYTIKGGSYLCADNFCRRYRPDARQPQDNDLSTSHIGFRIVRDLPSES